MDCPLIPQMDLEKFFKRLTKKMVSGRLPLLGSFEVTERCNLRCAHCYINQSAGDQIIKEKELSLQEIQRILDEITNEGCLLLLITGGEPLLRSDFLDIYTYAKLKGFLITLFTNGTTITPRIADHLAEQPPHMIEITIYGITQKTYELITGIPGSYRQCLKGINLLRERKIPLKLKTMVMTLNQHELDDMKAFAEMLGLSFRFDPVINPRLDGNRKPVTLRLDPQEVVALDLADEKRSRVWEAFIKNYYGSAESPEHIYNCGAGKRSFHINAYGQLGACIMARTPNYNLRQGTFQDGWNIFMQKVRSQKWSKEMPCQHCQIRNICDQCPGSAQIEFGDQESQVEHLCQIAHLRTKVFSGMDIPKGVKNEY